MKLTTKNVMLVCVIMALAASLVYLLMFLNILIPDELASEEGLPPFFLIIPGGYLLGGLLVLVKKRWLWITGAAVNTFTICVFYATYAVRPAIMLSAAGLLTKIAQVILEIGLIYLVVTYKRNKTAA
jgi:hypothetical protein